ncbi:MAG: flippase [Patescibacteria group bacterium]
MSIAKKILGNTAIQIAGRAVMAVTSVVILKSISNFLGVEGYGTYTAVYEYLAFFGIAADLGLFTIGVREMGKGLRPREFIAGNIMGMRMVTAATAMILSVVIAFLIPNYSGTNIPVGVAIGSIAVFLSIMHGTVSSVLQVEHKMQWSTFGLVGGKLISMFWMLAVVYYFYIGDPSAAAFNNLIWAGVAGNGFALIFTIFFALRVVRFRPSFSMEYWREIFVSALPYGTALVLSTIYFRIDSIMLLFMKGPHEVGLYGMPMRILEILSVIPVYFMNSVLPILSKGLREKSSEVRRMIQLSFDFLFMCAAPIVVGLFVLAYPVIFLISSPEFLSRLSDGYYGSDIAMQILVFAMFFSFLNSLFSYTLVAANKQSILLWINGAAAIFNISANLIVIPRWGFRGAAVNTVVTEILILCAACYFAKKYVDFKITFGTFIRTFFSAIVMGAVVFALKDPTYNLWGLQNFNVLLLGVIGVAVYGGLILTTGAVPEEFRRKMRIV